MHNHMLCKYNPHFLLYISFSVLRKVSIVYIDRLLTYWFSVHNNASGFKGLFNLVHHFVKWN
jgi:hypothetical protein